MRSRLIASTILVALLVPLLLVGFWRTRVDAAFHDDVVRVANWLKVRGFDFVDYSFMDFAANTLWFLPFAAIAVLIVRARRWPLVLLACVAVSVGIELGQAYLLPERVGTPLDVFANTLGAVAGIILGAAIEGIVVLSRRRIQPRLAPAA